MVTKRKMAARNNVREAIVSYAIEKSLIDYGNSALEEIYYKLYEEHALHFVDCYHNPEVLRKVMLDTFGDAYCNIVDLIKKNLGEYARQEHIRKFLSSLE